LIVFVVIAAFVAQMIQTGLLVELGIYFVGCLIGLTVCKAFGFVK
jgi:hypothetical protein